MHRIFTLGKIKFIQPETEYYFSILLIHQNRYKGNQNGAPAKCCIHEEMIPSFMDLVIWGHEHDCSIQPVQSLKSGGNYYIIQPGSTVATSLSKGDATFKRNCFIQIQ